MLKTLTLGALAWSLQAGAQEALAGARAADEIRLTSVQTGEPETILAEAMTAEGAEACFRTPMSLALLTETYAVYERPAPEPGPGCLDARRLRADLATGTAVAFLSEREVAPGMDRVVAIYPDGRAYAWIQLNEKAGK